jgi:predicted alpha/beta-fold hydrolase
MYSLDALKRVKSIWDFDDVYTGPLFGFGSAVNYYRTQSSSQYLEKIRVPALLVQAKDDPLIPFEVYDHPAFREKPVAAARSGRARRARGIHLAPSSRASGWTESSSTGWNR